LLTFEDRIREGCEQQADCSCSAISSHAGQAPFYLFTLLIHCLFVTDHYQHFRPFLNSVYTLELGVHQVRLKLSTGQKYANVLGTEVTEEHCCAKTVGYFQLAKLEPQSDEESSLDNKSDQAVAGENHSTTARCLRYKDSLPSLVAIKNH
jgi:hypothetical protein